MPDDAVTHVLGIDSGGSGVRVAVARVAAPGGPAEQSPTRSSPLTWSTSPTWSSPLTWSSSTPAAVGDRGIDAESLLARVLPAAQELLREAGARRLGAVCVGAAGMATLGDDLRARLPDALAEAFGVRRLALAADAVTAYAGALGQRPGAVVAAGTGLIALGAVPEGFVGGVAGTDGDSGTDGVSGADGVSRTDGLRDAHSSARTDTASARGASDGDTRWATGGWRRADGWGHLLGDCGGGAWIGRAGLEAAMRAYDGREGGSKPLLARLEAVFGPATGLPGQLYPRPDRPAVLASFAPEVGRCACEDPVAEAILRAAARHIAEAAEAVCPRLESCEVALTGGLFRMGAPLLTPVREELAARLPGVGITEAAGDPLDGALCVAAALASDGLRLPRDPALLSIV
ncbi:N-acetylglucosamine kinase [Streptomyces sp. PSAA01]|uniref:N-acetylglucosamine kinase n=1 Tax=Streptomyces sp. PSAA01 TaxID=2912762 RepID=UPI001F27665F|nr:BadF/BadG/BcrA/BcrD ATPase family protein [Streptomyces sp. PSAA01]MCG0285789.1 ATPase [Streptomyces sp. PSAA01]